MSDALAVLDAAGSERAAVFASRGPSMEGILLAATHPERVSHLIVVSGQARTAYASDYPMGVPQSLLDEFLATNTEPDAVDRGFDLLALVAPTVSRDNAFRRWWIVPATERRAPRWHERFSRSSCDQTSATFCR